MNNSSWDTLVIGGGAAGLSAALMLGRSQRRVLVVDAGEQRNLRADHMHGVLGQEGVPPAELIARGREEVRRYGVELLDGAVTGITESGEGLVVHLADGGERQTRSVVVATGLVDEFPDVPGLAERWGSTVLQCPYCHGWEFRDTHLGVLVTSDDGLHQAEVVRQWSSQVTVFTAGTALEPEAERRLRARGIQIMPGDVVGLGEDPGAVCVQLDDGREVVVDALFTTSNLHTRDRFLDDVEMDRTETSHGALLTVDAAGQTTHERIWAAGNVVNAVSTVAVAIGEGATVGAAVNNALVEWDVDDAVAALGGE